jgi:hypothetical protein
MESTGEWALTSEGLEWRLRWDPAGLVSAGWTNRRSGRSWELSGVQELALVVSAAPDRVEEPRRLADFAVEGVSASAPDRASAHLRGVSVPVAVRLRYELDGPTRRKWVEVDNLGEDPLLLLDVELDDFALPAPIMEGGEGHPVLIAGEAWAAIEHPAGWNLADGGRVRMAHYPGVRVPPGGTFRSHVAVVGATAPEQALPEFVAYLQARCRRRPRFLSV